MLGGLFDTSDKRLSQSEAQEIVSYVLAYRGQGCGWSLRRVRPGTSVFNFSRHALRLEVLKPQLNINIAKLLASRDSITTRLLLLGFPRCIPTSAVTSHRFLSFCDLGHHGTL